MSKFNLQENLFIHYADCMTRMETEIHSISYSNEAYEEIQRNPDKFFLFTPYDQRQKEYSNHSHSLLAMRRHIRKYWRNLISILHQRNPRARQISYPVPKTRRSLLRNLSEMCTIWRHIEFRDKDDQIRDRLIVGILGNDLIEKLQLESELLEFFFLREMY